MSGVAMSKLEGLIWMNNELVDWKDAKIHVLTHTLHYGMGVFEGIRCYKIAEGGAVFRLTDHIRRLLDLNVDKVKDILICYCSRASCGSASSSPNTTSCCSVCRYTESITIIINFSYRITR